jgi:hypothetical protein
MKIRVKNRDEKPSEVESKIVSWNVTEYVESDTLEILIKYKSPAEISTPVRYKI